MVLIKVESKYLADDVTRLINFYRANPVIAANQLLRIDNEPLVLAPIQEVVLTEWWTHKFNLLTASRGAGKSFISAVYIALRCILFPGTKFGIFAPAFRQSKIIFKEFTRLYHNSPVLQQCIDKEPVEQNDQCICIFKAPSSGLVSSSIKALPVGSDGGKIRGERMNVLCMDEVPHLPEAVFRTAIQPMLSTARNPMQRVQAIEKAKEEMGEDFDPEMFASANGYIGITSGYYQFNYWWQEMLKFWEFIQKGSPNYNLRFIPFTELPPGFYDEDLVNDARLNSPSHMFQTEWMAKWIADSEGAFAMSLLENSRDRRVRPKTCRDMNTDKGKEFVIGIDPARESDSTAIVVIELGYPSKVVHIEELEETIFQQQAKVIFTLVEKFNPKVIYMDEFGGGGTLRDLLADPRAVGMSQSQKIISTESPMTDSGKRLLKLCNFNPQFIEDANNEAKTLLEQGALKLPTAEFPVEGKRKSNVSGITKEVDLVQEMINQIAAVVVTQTSSGKLHYDLPKKGGGGYGVSKKDLYTAFILSCKAVYDVQWKPKEEHNMVSQGVIKEIGTKDSGLLTGAQGPGTIEHRRVLGNSTDFSTKKVVTGGGIIVGRNVKR